MSIWTPGSCRCDAPRPTTAVMKPRRRPRACSGRQQARVRAGEELHDEVRRFKRLVAPAGFEPAISALKERLILSRTVPSHGAAYRANLTSVTRVTFYHVAPNAFRGEWSQLGHRRGADDARPVVEPRVSDGVATDGADLTRLTSRVCNHRIRRTPAASAVRSASERYAKTAQLSTAKCAQQLFEFFMLASARRTTAHLGLPSSSFAGTDPRDHLGFPESTTGISHLRRLHATGLLALREPPRMKCLRLAARHSRALQCWPRGKAHPREEAVRHRSCVWMCTVGALGGILPRLQP